MRSGWFGWLRNCWYQAKIRWHCGRLHGKNIERLLRVWATQPEKIWGEPQDDYDTHGRPIVVFSPIIWWRNQYARSYSYSTLRTIHDDCAIVTGEVGINHWNSISLDAQFNGNSALTAVDVWISHLEGEDCNPQPLPGLKWSREGGLVCHFYDPGYAALLHYLRDAYGDSVVAAATKSQHVLLSFALVLPPKVIRRALS